jgi:flagellar hook-associated protein FlgK
MTAGWERRIVMRFQDLFVPRWQHSNPEVRIKAIGRMKDAYLLNQIVEQDEHQMVRDAAAEQLAQITDQIRVSE